MITMNDINISFQKTLIESGSLIIPNGCVTGIIGKSGTGKTALLEVIGLLSDQPSHYLFDDDDIGELSDDERKDRLRYDISFIFQDIQLFEDLTLKENMHFYASLVNKQISDDEIYHQLDMVGLNVDIHTYVKTMSIGERQRVSILCGLLKDAKLFIFDEPTAYLDSKNEKIIMDIIFKLAHEMNKMVVIATHNQEFIKRLDRIYVIENQQLLLKKDIDMPIYKAEKRSYLPLTMTTLHHYVKTKRSKSKYIHVIISMILSMIICSCVFSVVYTYQYNQESHGDLLNLLHHELNVVKKDGSFITPKDYSLLENQINNPLHPVVELNGSIVSNNKQYNDIIITSFYDFENLEDHLLNGKEKSECYISYQLYRKMNNANQSLTIHYKQSKITFDHVQVLSPHYTELEYLYISSDAFDKVLLENDIDVYNMPLQQCKIQLHHFDDIKTIINTINDQYETVSIYPIESRINIMNTFNPYIMLLIDILTIILFAVYQIYQCIHNKNEIALLKTLGISHLNLLKMKAYELGLYFKEILIISTLILIFVIIILKMSWFILFALLFIHLFVIGIVSLVPYQLLVCAYSPSLLLRK